MLATCLAVGEVVIKDGDSIAFLGDSITYLGYSEKPNGYIHLVIEGLKAAGVNATPIPAGVGGNTAHAMLARLDRDVISKKAVWMTLNSGINDTSGVTVEEFGATLAKIVDQATAAGIKVILMNTTIAASENLDCADSLKRLQYCEEFKKLAKERDLILVDLNAALTRELIERRKDDPKGPIILCDGIHLNGLGHQIVAAEILRALGVSESDVAALRKRWDDYPFAVAKPVVSVGDYVKLKALAAKNGTTVNEQVSEMLTNSVK
jgi:lysophospholipase L1-like esterase